MRRAAARAISLLGCLTVAAAGPLPGSAGTTQATAPQITLLTPAHGSIVESSAQKRNAVGFQWRVDWPHAPTTGSVIVSVKWARDPSFTQEVSGANHTCPAANANCWTSFRPNHAWKGRYFWKVEIAGASRPVSSSTWMFVAVEPAHQVDRIRPYVVTFAGTARRGKPAYFTARVRDNTSQVRLRAVLTYRGLPVLEGRTPFTNVRWRDRQRFSSIRPLSRSLVAGVYKICITAWDRAGNQGRSCARYRVR